MGGLTEMKQLSFADSFVSRCPKFRVAVTVATLPHSAISKKVEALLVYAENKLREEFDTASIKQRAAVLSTRDAYKALGKDPNRYRPASEQLCRRLVQGKGLYFINPLVDLGNYISIATGYSIGVFDYDKIGNQITLKRGEAEDDFEGIGRGKLNIEGLPTYIDENGPFATPTSDHERTKVSENHIRRTLIFINDFGANPLDNGDDRLKAAAEELKDKIKELFENAKVNQKIIGISKEPQNIPDMPE